MTTASRTAFPSPYEMTTPHGAEGWEQLYPYYMVFQPWRRADEEGRFWFRDSQHWPTVVKPFETVITELSFKGLGQFNTRYFVVPPAYGVMYRIHQGYVYLQPGGCAGKPHPLPRAAVPGTCGVLLRELGQAAGKLEAQGPRHDP